MYGAILGDIIGSPFEFDRGTKTKDFELFTKGCQFTDATELKINLGKYLMLAETEDIYITRNGKVVAKLSNPYQDRVDVAKSLFGVLSNDMTLEEAREERLNTI